MATWFRTCVRASDGAATAVVSRALIELLGAKCSGQGVTVRLDGAPWFCVENLGFISLKPSRQREVVDSIASLWRSETIMLGAQSTASCGVYAHYVGGKLTRFLSAGDGVWLQ